MNFVQGEMMHEVDTCIVCQETRPIFHITKVTYNSINGASLQKGERTPWWSVDDDSICKRCLTNLNKRKNLSAAKVSGINSLPEHCGKKSDIIRHNNMHFMPVPPYLQNISLIETALIQEISVLLYIQ